MQTLSHLALQPAVNARPMGGFEQSLAQASLRRVEAKEFVFAEGDPTTHLFRVETGAIALYKILNDGRRQIVGFAYPGDLIGLGAQGEHVMNAQAIKPTRLRCLPIATLHHSAAKDPTLGFKLYEALARELAATRDLMLTTGQRSATERVVSFLLAFSRRNERNGQDPCRLRAADDTRRHRRFSGSDHRDREPHVHQAQDSWPHRAAAQQSREACRYR